MRSKLFPWLTGCVLLVVIFFASFSSPSVLQANPSEESNKVTFDAPFTIHFSHLMDRGTVESAFKIYPKISGNFSWKDWETLEFYPEEPLTIGDHYQIILKGSAKSLWMKKIGFDTILEYVVTGPPYVLFVTPSKGEFLASDDVITVMFDRPMELNGLKKEQMIQSQPPLEGDIRLVGLSAFQFIAKKIDIKKQYLLTIPAGIEAKDGGITKEDFSWPVLGPSLQVLKSSPAKDTMDVNLSEPIQISFNEDVPLEAIKPGINALLYPSNDLDAASNPKMDGFFNTDVTFGDSHSILIFTPSFPYLPDTTYQFVLKHDVNFPLDQNFVLTFKTPTGGKTSSSSNTETVKDNPQEGMDFFVVGQKPSVTLDHPLSSEASLSVCQVPSGEYIRLTARGGWDDYTCERDPVRLNATSTNAINSIQLSDYFDLEWVPGVYFVSLSIEGKKIVKHFMVEDSVLLLKKTDQNLLVWALDIHSGLPLANMDVELLDYHGETVTRGKTNDDGLFTVNKAFEAGLYVRGKIEDEDLGKSRWGLVFDQWSDTIPKMDDHSGFKVFVNQHTFSPEETLKIKGIWRTPKENLLGVSEAMQVRVDIIDDHQNSLIYGSFPMRRNGTFDGELKIPQGSPSGHYQVTFSDVNGQLIKTHPIHIQEQAEITLEWNTAKDHHAANTTPLYFAQARYTNGLPAAKLKAVYQLYQTPAPYHDQGGAFDYFSGRLSSRCDSPCSKETTLIKEEEVVFDLDGQARLILTDQEEGFLPAGYQYDLILTALSNGSIAKLQQSFNLHHGTFDLGFGLKHTVIEPDSPIEASLIAKDYEGRFLAGKSVKISLVDSQEKSTVFQEEWTTKNSPLFLSIPIQEKIEDGVYVLRAEALDEKHNVLLAELPLILSRKAIALSETPFLTVDQTRYLVGGRARFLIHEPSASEEHPVASLITYERDGILGHEAVVLKSPVTLVTLPIKDIMMPYFLVKVTHLGKNSPPSFVSFVQKIDVEKPHSTIHVDLSYEPNDLTPGKEITLKFFTHDAQNQPLPSILSVNVSNEPFQNPGLSYATFFSKSYLPLPTTTNVMLPPVSLPASFNKINETPFNQKPSSSAYFNPLIPTDVNGLAEVTWTLPKTGEKLYVEILATHGSMQFGYQTGILKTHEKLLIRPILPSFAVPGDQAVFSAVIKNGSEETVNSKLTLVGSDLTTTGDATRHFSLGPEQETQLDFNVFISPTINKSSLLLRFESGDDFVEKTLPVRTLHSLVKVSDFRKENFWKGNFSLPKEAIAGLTTMKILVGASPLVIAHMEADTLRKAESVSSFIWVLRLLAQLQLLPENPVENDLASLRHMLVAIQKNLEAEGGYRLWKETPPDPVLSAFVLLAYKEAFGHSVIFPDTNTEKTLEYVFHSLDQAPLSLDEKLFILWVLGRHGQFDTKRTLDYFQGRSTASLEGKAFLLMNLNDLVKAGQKSVIGFYDRLKAEIADAAILLQTVGSEGQEEKSISFNDSPETTAILLYAMSDTDSENPLLKPMVHFLSTRRKRKNFTLKESIWKVLALKHYTVKTQPNDLHFLAQVNVNGVKVMDRSITDSNAEEIFSSFVDAKLLQSDGNELSIQKKGSGSMFVEATLDAIMDPLLLKPLEQGAVLTRQFYAVTEDGLKIPTLVFKKGSSAISELQLIVPKDSHQVILRDEIPAGFKVDGELPSNSPFTRTQLPSGSIIYFSPLLPAGVHKIETFLTPLLPGSFTSLPASASSMTDSSLIARTVGEKIRINP